MLLSIVFFAFLRPSVALDNGLALTPPMGWLSWAAFECQVDCRRHPLTCVSEDLYKEMADRLVLDGYVEAGYNFINIDDCWSNKRRAMDGQLQADPERFPNGIKALADYMHKRNLKLGIYADFGWITCAGYPGSLLHLKLDATTFARWKVDMLKLDGCAVDVALMATGYPEMGRYLNATGRPIVYSCSWPFYEAYKGINPNYTRVAQFCNLWRSYDDIELSWKSILSVIDWMDQNQDDLVGAVGPGRWNDPDMLIVGLADITEDQAKVQMALWSIWSAPLLMSNDLRFITAANRKILLNRKVIAVNQDRLGKMGMLIHKVSNVSIYRKEIMPKSNDGNTSFALAFFNRHPTDKAVLTVDHLHQLGLRNKLGYKVTELFTDKSFGTLLPDDKLQSVINPTGIVMLTAIVKNS